MILEEKKYQLSVKLGFWSAVLCIIAFATWIVSFIAIVTINPMFTWTNLTDFLSYVKEYNQFFKHLAESAMILFGLSFVILLSSIENCIVDHKKILAKISVYFGIIFTTLISLNYFVQLTTVRINIMNGKINGLEQFIQSNPTSGFAAINMLGWSLFFGVSSLFIAPVFSDGRLEKLIKYSFFANGIICIIGGISYAFNIVIIIFLSMNLGMGASVLITIISLAIWFKGKIKKVTS